MTKTRVLLGAAILAAGVVAPAAVLAQSQPFPTHRRGDGYTYYREHRSARPDKGYEGFTGVGPSLRYCSYRRIPHRECDRRGCRATSWTLQQFCY